MSVFGKVIKNREGTFEYVGAFIEGNAAIKLTDGSGYSFVRADGSIWKQRFFETKDFCGGYAIVSKGYKKETLIDRDGNEFKVVKEVIWDKRTDELKEIKKPLESVHILSNSFYAGYASCLDEYERIFCVARNGKVFKTNNEREWNLIKDSFGHLIVEKQCAFLDYCKRLQSNKELLKALIYECDYRVAGKMYDPISLADKIYFEKLAKSLKKYVEDPCMEHERCKWDDDDLEEREM